MKNNTSILVLVILVIAAGLIGWNWNKNRNVEVINQPEPQQEEVATITGCYVARTNNDKDLYTLRIDRVNGIYTYGTLSFKNYEKDSSSGTFEGLFQNDVLLANYLFQSEGTTSNMEVAFKKVGSDFVRGYGEVDASTGTKFVNPSTLTYDAASTLSLFKKENCTN